MADRNEPVGANLRRLFSRLRNREAEEYGASLEGQQDTIGRQTGPRSNRSMRETIRGVEAPVATRESQPMPVTSTMTPRSITAGGRSMQEPEITEEVLASRRLRSGSTKSMEDPENTDAASFQRTRNADIANMQSTQPSSVRTPTSEASAVAASRNAARAAAAARPNTRTRPSSARGSEMSADDINAMSLARGVGADNAPDTAAAVNIRRRLAEMEPGMKKGGRVKKMAKGGAVKKMAGGGAARGDGCATRGKTKGRMI